MLKEATLPASVQEQISAQDLIEKPPTEAAEVHALQTNGGNSVGALQRLYLLEVLARQAIQRPLKLLI